MDTQGRQPANDSSPPASLGAYLVEQRLRHGLDAEEIARRTGIHLAVIRALEADDHASLPRPVFVRGFIKLYVQTLDLDPARALALYEAEAARLHQEAPPIGPDILSSESLAETPLVTRRKLVLGGLALLVLLFAVAGGRYLVPFFRNHGPAPPIATAPVAPPVATTPPPPAPAGGGEQAATPPAAGPGHPEETATPAAAGEQPAAAGQPPVAADVPPPPTPATLRLEAEFTAPTWMRLTIDDQAPQEAFYQAGSRYQWEAEHGYKLLIGNAGGIRLRLDGKPVALTGGSGQVVRLTLP